MNNRSHLANTIWSTLHDEFAGKDRPLHSRGKIFHRKILSCLELSRRMIEKAPGTQSTSRGFSLGPPMFDLTGRRILREEIGMPSQIWSKIHSAGMETSVLMVASYDQTPTSLPPPSPIVGSASIFSTALGNAPGQGKASEFNKTIYFPGRHLKSTIVCTGKAKVHITPYQREHVGNSVWTISAEPSLEALSTTMVS